MTACGEEYDLAVVGAGIVGLAHALAAVRRGLRTIVIDRDARANGASVRNFGFVTETGQLAGTCWRRAMRSRDVWAEVAPKAGIRIVHQGLALMAQRPEAEEVISAFMRTEMADGCRILSLAEAAGRVPSLRSDAVRAVLWSPHELRVESRSAIPLLADWLAREHGVTILRETLVHEVAPPDVETTAGRIRAARVVVCPGDDYLALFPDRIASYGLTRCQLLMLRIAPPTGTRIGAAVMSDLGLARYLGYAELPEAAHLRRRLEAEQAEALAHGVHLIAVQSADGTMVVGDSHLYENTPEPFADAGIEELILAELDAVLDLPGRRVTERWTGIYASATDRLMLVDAPGDDVRIVIITSGTGASTAFAIGEEVVAELFA